MSPLYQARTSLQHRVTPWLRTLRSKYFGNDLYVEYNWPNKNNFVMVQTNFKYVWPKLALKVPFVSPGQCHAEHCMFALQVFPWQKYCVTVMWVRILMPTNPPVINYNILIPRFIAFGERQRAKATSQFVISNLGNSRNLEQFWCSLILKEWSRIVLFPDDEFVKSNVRGILGHVTNRKSTRNVSVIKIAQNR